MGAGGSESHLLNRLAKDCVVTLWCCQRSIQIVKSSCFRPFIFAAVNAELTPNIVEYCNLQRDRSANLPAVTCQSLVVPQNSDDGFAIADSSRHNEPHNFRERNQFMLDALIGLGPGNACLQSPGQKYCHGFFQEAGAGIKEEGFFPQPGAIAGFFQQLALACSQRKLSGIDSSGRQLEHVILRSIAVLALQKDARIGCGVVYREDNHRSGMTYDFTDGGNAIRLLHPVASDMEDPSLKDGVG